MNPSGSDFSFEPLPMWTNPNKLFIQPGFLPPADKVCEGNVFTCVCLSTGAGGLSKGMGSLSGRGALSGGGLCPEGSVWGSVSRGRGLWPGGGSVSRGSVGGVCQPPPPYAKERAVRILLECILLPRRNLYEINDLLLEVEQYYYICFISADLKEPDLSHSTPILSPFSDNGIPSEEAVSDDSDADDSPGEREDNHRRDAKHSPGEREDDDSRDANRWRRVQSGDAVFNLVKWFYLWVVDPGVTVLTSTPSGLWSGFTKQAQLQWISYRPSARPGRVNFAWGQVDFQLTCLGEQVTILEKCQKYCNMFPCVINFEVFFYSNLHLTSWFSSQQVKFWITRPDGQVEVNS